MPKPTQPHWRKIVPPSPLRELIPTIQKAGMSHKAWPIAESFLRLAFDAIEVYAANQEFGALRQQLEDRVAALEWKIKREEKPAKPAAKKRKATKRKAAKR